MLYLKVFPGRMQDLERGETIYYHVPSPGEWADGLAQSYHEETIKAYLEEHPTDCDL